MYWWSGYFFNKYHLYLTHLTILNQPMLLRGDFQLNYHPGLNGLVKEQYSNSPRAGGLSLITEIPSIHPSSYRIYTDLASIYDRSMRNKVCLNSQKTQSMAIHRHEPSSLPPLLLRCSCIASVIPIETRRKLIGALLLLKFQYYDILHRIDGSIDESILSTANNLAGKTLS